LRVAIVHEWLTSWAGSERVLSQILSCFPDADLFALVDFLSDEDRANILQKRATTTFLQRMPSPKRLLPYYLPLMPIAIEQLDLSTYDLVISSSHAVAKGVITGPDQLHISYVHSPMRYAWDQQHQYLRGKNGRGLRGFALRLALHYLRQWDLRTVNGVDLFVANSQFIAKRIRKVYRREATVIYPPVDIEAFPHRELKEDFYLCAGRLEPYKRIDIVVQAFSEMPSRKLVVLGDGPEYKTLKRLAASNVEFMGYQPNEVWLSHLQKAKALIFPGIEDFGITPVEAQACGTPVIAFGRGGVLETVRPLGEPQPTGLFFLDQTPAAICKTVLLFESQQSKFSSIACRMNAEQFSVSAFRSRFTQFVTNAKLSPSSDLP
jgi:glycosyltransferase involved in cell wall biosynthesis